MSEKYAELSLLKQEVAELWGRFRKDEAPAGNDDERRSLADLARTLETKRRLLADRRTELRDRLDSERRRTSRFVPVVHGLGMFAGVGLGAVAMGWLVPLAAEWCLALTPIHGALLVAVALLGASAARGRSGAN